MDEKRMDELREVIDRIEMAIEAGREFIRGVGGSVRKRNVPADSLTVADGERLGELRKRVSDLCGDAEDLVVEVNELSSRADDVKNAVTALSNDIGRVSELLEGV